MQTETPEELDALIDQTNSRKMAFVTCRPEGESEPARLVVLAEVQG